MQLRCDPPLAWQLRASSLEEKREVHECLIPVAGGAVLFTMGAEPQPLDIPPEARLRILVTNTKVPGRSTKRMVAIVGNLVTGALGKTVGEPLLDAMGALSSQHCWHCLGFV